MGAVVVVEVLAEGEGDHRDRGRQVVEPDADRLVGVEGQRTDVAVRLQVLGADQLEQVADEVVVVSGSSMERSRVDSRKRLK